MQGRGFRIPACLDKEDKMWDKKIKGKFLAIMLVIAIILVTAAGCTFNRNLINGSPQNTSQNTSSSYITRTTVNPENLQVYPDFTGLIAKARPSVVAITTEATMRLWGRVFTQEGAGSGWIITQDGLIVTNYHVIEESNSIAVTLDNGDTYTAQIVGTDSDSDLALIKIDAQNLPALQIGNSSGLLVGEWVVALGNSLGLGISATKGIVSALNVSLSNSPGESLDGLIQTDAAINPGNSGGPLLNLSGEVIGINSAKIAKVGVEGMGYAINIEEALAVIESLKSGILR
jgi:serine protease Do